MLLAAVADGRAVNLESMACCLFSFISRRRGGNALPTPKVGCLTAEQTCLLMLGAVIFSAKVFLEQTGDLIANRLFLYFRGFFFTHACIDVLIRSVKNLSSVA